MARWAVSSQSEKAAPGDEVGLKTKPAVEMPIRFSHMFLAQTGTLRNRRNEIPTVHDKNADQDADRNLHPDKIPSHKREGG
jgi:hypothetical protein